MADRIRQRFPGRNEFQTSDDVFGDTRLWGNERASKYPRSTDVKHVGKFDTYDGGGSRSEDSSDSLDSELGETGRGDKRGSDSGSDHQRWTKNPLMIRKVRRSNKPQQAEKRWSGAGTDVAAGSTVGFIYHCNDGGVGETHSLGRNTNSNVGGSSSKGSSKYQRLEEMRRKRINLSITSDEESTAQTTRAPLRYGSHVRSFPSPSSRIEPARHTETCKSHYGAETVHKISLQPGPAAQPSTLPARSLQVAPKESNYSTRFQPAIASTGSSPSHAKQGFSSQTLTSEFSGKITPQYLTNQQAPTSYPQRTESREPSYRQLDVTGSRQPFYKIVDKTSPPTTRALCNSAPQFTINKFTAVDSPPKPNGIGLQNLHYIKPRESPPRAQVSRTSTFFRPSPPNTGLDRATKEELPKSHKIPKTGLSNLRRCGHSDDSLDELVESNIRYLDRTTDKSTTKRNSGTNFPRNLGQAAPRNVTHSPHSQLTHSPHSQLTHSPHNQLTHSPHNQLTHSPHNQLTHSPHNQLTHSPHNQLTHSPHNQLNHPSVQVRTSTSIQLHVSVPTVAYTTSPVTAAHRLQIEPASDRCGFDDQGISPPDVVPRKMTRGICWRTNSEYPDRDGLTHSDNTDQFVGTSHLKNNLQPETVFTRGRASEGKTRSDTEVSRPTKQVERGMFSDVEYDIEVSERVKKWETLLKVRDHKRLGNKDCDTILENLEGESPALPSGNDPRNSALPWQQFQLGSPYPTEAVQASTSAPRELRSEKSVLKSENWTAKNVPSVEANARRLFQVLPEPPLHAQSQSVHGTMFHAPASTRAGKPLTSPDQSRQQLFANRVHAIPVTNTSADISNKAPLFKGYEHQPQSQTDAPLMARLSQGEGHQTRSQRDAPLATRPSRLINAHDVTKRGSVYKEELDEISGLKAETVINLRRHFDTGSTTVTSEDDQKSVSTASAKLTRPGKEHRTQNEPVDWSKVIPGYKTMIKDSDLWSPNLESTQGVPVSIERVTARTLQTIPFSEDPFWKEMEEITSFDPTGSVGHLNVGIAHERALTVDPLRSHPRVELERALTVDPLRSHHRVELIPPQQSLTLPNQLWHHVIPATDRIQKSKSLYTPNITHMSVDANRKIKSDAVIALDAVLNDINRSSLDRKQQSPGRKLLEAENTSTVSPFVHVSRDLQNYPNTARSKMAFEDGQGAPKKLGSDPLLRSVKPIISSNLDHVRSEAVTSQPCQHQPQQQQLKKTVGKPQISQGILSGYQLDPNLLKQKLLKTGLVVETDTEEQADKEKYRRSWPRSSAPGTSVTSSTTTPTHTKVTAQSSYNFTSKEPILSTSRQASIMQEPILSTSRQASIMQEPILSTSRQASIIQEPILSTSRQASIMSGTATVGNMRSWSQKQAGLTTLDNLHNALSPFRSTSYQPGPESLYGSSRLESFREPTLSTAGKALTSTTGLAYHNQMNEGTEQTRTKECSVPSSSSRLQEVNQSMDDLKSLALDVEQRIIVIKNRLQSANENSLDSILSSLRTLAPEVKRHEIEPASFEDYYTTKKSKLSDALTELDRIYNNLELNVHDVKTLPNKGDHKVYSRPASNYPVVGTQQPKSVHLRPMQTRISSVFIRGVDSTNKNNTEKESQIDVISKSFQAIVDEVNKTTELLSRVAERNRQENMAPETQKQTFKMTVKAGNAKIVNPLTCPITDVVLKPSTPSVVARPVQVQESVDSEVRQKLENSLKDDIVDGKIVPESVPDRETSTLVSLRRALQPAAGIGQVPQQTMASTVMVTASAATKQTSPASEVTRQQALAKSDQDNNIIQEDRAAKHQSSEKTFWVSSPTLSRKATNSPGSGVKLQSPQVLSENKTEEVTRSEIIHETELDHVPITVQFTANTSAINECSNSSNSSNSKSHPSSCVASPTNMDLATTTANPTPPPTPSITANPTPSVTENNTFRLAPPDSKLDDSESDLSANPNTNWRVGEGVTMQLDRLSSDKVDSPKPTPGPRSIPDVGEQLTEAADNQDSKLVQTQPTDTRENAQSSDPPVRNCEQFLLNNQAPSACEKSVVSFLVKKVGDPETKAATPETCSPEPSSPVNKQAVSHKKKQTLDQDKQSVDDDIQACHPKFLASETRTMSSGESTPSEGYLTPKEGGSPREAICGISLPGANIQTEPPNNRPHSFHELISCSETGGSGIQANDKFRKFASTSEVNSDTL